MKNLNISIDVETIRAKIIEQTIQEIKSNIDKQIKKQVASDYELGIYIKDRIQDYIKNNLKQLVLNELNNVDIKQKVDKAVEIATVNLVQEQMKKFKF